MTADPSAQALRAALEAWEREAAAQWDAVIRSPRVLSRLGAELNRSLRSQQRIQQTLHSALLASATAQDATAHALYRLEQIEAQITALAARIDRLETILDADAPRRANRS